MIALAALALAAGLLYYLVSGDYAFLRASILTGSPTGAYHALGDKLAARALKKNTKPSGANMITQRSGLM